MADQFQGFDSITIQPGTDAAVYTFTFAICSSATANDGSIPFGDTISDEAVKAFDEDGSDVTGEIVDTSSSSTTVVTVALNYPSTSGAGRYSLEFVLTLASGAKMEFDFSRLYARDISAE